MTSGRALLGLVISCALTVAVVGVLTRPNRSGVRTPTPTTAALVPAGAWFVAELDVAQFRRARGAPAHGQGRALRELCGFDPNDAAQTIVASLSGAGDSLEIAVAVRGDFMANEVLDCAERVVRRRGGQPQRQRIGTVESVRDARGSGNAVAALAPGLVLLGSREFVARAGQTMPHRAPPRVVALLDNNAHASEAARAAASLDADWLQRMTGLPDAQRSPLAAVRQVVFSVALGSSPAIAAEVGCDSVAGCQRLARLLGDVQQDFGKEVSTVLAIDLATQSTLILRGSKLRVELSLSYAQTEKLYELIQSLALDSLR